MEAGKMAIDPRLSLGIQPPQIQSFLDPMLKVQHLNEGSQRNMLLQRGLQQEDLQLQNKNRLSRILAGSMKNGKLDTAIARQKLAEAGLGEEALNLSTMEREQQKEQRLQQKDQLEMMLNVIDAQQKVALGSSAETWETRDRPMIIQLGQQINPDMQDIPELPQQWSPELVQQALEKSKTVQQRLQEQHQQAVLELQKEGMAQKQQATQEGLDLQRQGLQNTEQFRKQQLELQNKKSALTTGINKPIPTGQAKQVIGVSNLGDAIDEYTKQLDKFSLSDLASPDARAAMGTKYNNMMLQAKEAYNLGVLNGPDYDILTSVITDPRSFKGAITSNKALKDQALELKRMMGKIASTANKTYIGNNIQQPEQPQDFESDPDWEQFSREYDAGGQ